ncbi:MAG TPA: GNAT family N-acetyltransferase [Kofleriaceae bacterium]|jgi:phosphinothricin acetyltransferase
MAPAVRLAATSDFEAVAAIVNHYIATTAINFRTEPQTAGEWRAEWEPQRARFPWLVAEAGGEVIGVAYAAPWKTRAAYDWSAEVTVYVRHGHARRGVGGALYRELLGRLDAQGYRTQIAVIALPNEPSVAAHEALGFRPAGRLEAVGYKHGAWHDVGFWQRRTGATDAPRAIGSV